MRGHDGVLRVAVVERTPVGRLGLVRLLQRLAGVEVVASGPAIEEAVEAEGVDVLVVGVSDRAIPPTELLERARDKGLRVLAVATGPLQVDEIPSLAAVTDGVVCEVTAEGLERALRSVAGGLHPFEGILPGWAWRRLAISGSEVRLSAVEAQVLRLLARGLPDREIGVELGLTASRVRYVVRSVLRKTGARNRAQAVALGLSQALTD